MSNTRLTALRRSECGGKRKHAELHRICVDSLRTCLSTAQNDSNAAGGSGNGDGGDDCAAKLDHMQNTVFSLPSNRSIIERLTHHCGYSDLLWWAKKSDAYFGSATSATLKEQSRPSDHLEMAIKLLPMDNDDRAEKHRKSLIVHLSGYVSILNKLGISMIEFGGKTYAPAKIFKDSMSFEQDFLNVETLNAR